MAKFNGKDGHWYTDQSGNHYFVGEGETPKEGWEATKRRKMIDGGKYKVDDGDGKGAREVSMEEYDKYEAEDGDFDMTTDDDFGFDTDDRPTPEQDLENEEIWDADYERSYGPYNFDSWDDVEMLKKAYEKAKDAGMDDSAQNALERIEELGGEFDPDEDDFESEVNEIVDRLKNESGMYYDARSFAEQKLRDYSPKAREEALRRFRDKKPADEEFDPDEEPDEIERMRDEGIDVTDRDQVIGFYVDAYGVDRKEAERMADGFMAGNGWKPSDEATPAYDAGGFYSMDEGDRWELDDGDFFEVRGIDGENVEVMTKNGTRRMTKDQLSDKVKNATKTTAEANSGKEESQRGLQREVQKDLDRYGSVTSDTKLKAERMGFKIDDDGKSSKVVVDEDIRAKANRATGGKSAGGNNEAPKSKKTVGETLQEMYEREFFKQANGNKEDFINHFINRFGVPRGSSRKREAEFYGKRFDELSASQGGSNNENEGQIDERKINHIEEYFNIWGKPSERELPDVIKHYGLNEKEAAELKKRLGNK